MQHDAEPHPGWLGGTDHLTEDPERPSSDPVRRSREAADGGGASEADGTHGGDDCGARCDQVTGEAVVASSVIRAGRGRMVVGVRHRLDRRVGHGRVRGAGVEAVHDQERAHEQRQGQEDGPARQAQRHQARRYRLAVGLVSRPSPGLVPEAAVVSVMPRGTGPGRRRTRRGSGWSRTTTSTRRG